MLLKDETGEQAFELERLVKSCCTVSHGQGFVERRFSVLISHHRVAVCVCALFSELECRSVSPWNKSADGLSKSEEDGTNEELSNEEAAGCKVFEKGDYLKIREENFRRLIEKLYRCCVSKCPPEKAKRYQLGHLVTSTLLEAL